MAIDKSHSPAWVKVTVWVLVVALIVGFVAIGFTTALMQLPALFGGQTAAVNPGAPLPQGTLDSINAIYEPQAAAAEAAVAEDPEDLNARRAVGNIYTTWGRALLVSTDASAQAEFAAPMAKAIPHWEKALELAPNDKAIAGDLATCLFYTGRTDEAIALAREILDNNPDYATVWFNLGNFLQTTGDLEGAKEAYAKAVETATATDGDLGVTAQAALDSLSQ